MSLTEGLVSGSAFLRTTKTPRHQAESFFASGVLLCPAGEGVGRRRAPKLDCDGKGRMTVITKKLVVLEVILGVFLASKIVLGTLGPKLNAERVKRSAEKLVHIPGRIEEWQWDETVKSNGAHINQVTGGGWNLFVRSYVRPASGDRLYFQVCRWLDPLSCYEMHGWQVVRPNKPLLTGELGGALRAAGVKEGWIEKNRERMFLLFYESDLLDPNAVFGGALTEDVGAAGRLSKLWGRTTRRVKSFFQKSHIVVKVIYLGDAENEQNAAAVLRFTREIRRILPEVLQ
jgi:hypothetical protein